MFEGKYYIDGLDMAKTYGIIPTEGSYVQLVQWASMKQVDSNDWDDEDGEEFDLSAPVLDARSFILPFACIGVQGSVGDFITKLSEGAYHIFNFAAIGLQFKLRAVSFPDYDGSPSLKIFSVKFSDDFPFYNYTYKAPVQTIADNSDYELDGKKLSAYNVRVLEGTLDSIRRAPEVKENLLVKIDTLSGVTYDDKNVHFKTKDVTINCLMTANSLEQLWQNYYALLHDLIQPNERMLYCDATGEEYPCKYKSCDVEDFYPSPDIWLTFKIVLTVTSCRPEEDELILASENGSVITTQWNDKAINMKRYESE
jgi:hypothetical protein